MAIKEKAKKVLQKAVKVCRSETDSCKKCPLYYDKNKNVKDAKVTKKEILCNKISSIAK